MTQLTKLCLPNDNFPSHSGLVRISGIDLLFLSDISRILNIMDEWKLKLRCCKKKLNIIEYVSTLGVIS